MSSLFFHASNQFHNYLLKYIFQLKFPSPFLLLQSGPILSFIGKMNACLLVLRFFTRQKYDSEVVYVEKYLKEEWNCSIPIQNYSTIYGVYWCWG